MRNFMLALGLLVVTACTDAAVQAPQYEPPLDGAAYKAFKAAIKADWLDKPYELGEAPETVNAMNYQKSVEYNEKQLRNKKAPKVYDALRKLKIKTCEWGALKKRSLPKRVQKRVSTPPAAAYHCSFTLHYQINPPLGTPYELESNGYFFIEDREFIYAGKFRNPY